MDINALKRKIDGPWTSPAIAKDMMSSIQLDAIRNIFSTLPEIMRVRILLALLYFDDEKRSEFTVGIKKLLQLASNDETEAVYITAGLVDKKLFSESVSSDNIRVKSTKKLENVTNEVLQKIDSIITDMTISESSIYFLPLDWQCITTNPGKEISKQIEHGHFKFVPSKPDLLTREQNILQKNAAERKRHTQVMYRSKPATVTDSSNVNIAAANSSKLNLPSVSAKPISSKSSAFKAEPIKKMSLNELKERNEKELGGKRKFDATTK